MTRSNWQAATPRAAAGPPPVWVPFETAKIHLKVRDTDHDAEINRTLNAATVVIQGYLKDRADPAWDDLTCPADVQQAVLIMLTHLYDDRGGADTAPSDSLGTLDAETWEAIGRLLVRRRDPALA